MVHYKQSPPVLVIDYSKHMRKKHSSATLNRARESSEHFPETLTQPPVLLQVFL